MVQDNNTDVIVLFIEGIRDPEKFNAAARRAAETGKPIVAIKVGRLAVRRARVGVAYRQPCRVAGGL